VSLRAAFADQARHCAGLGSPFMARLMSLAAERLRPEGRVGDRLFAWEGDLSGSGQSVQLRLAGALHALVLTGDPLGRVYPPAEATDDELWAAVDRALHDRADRVLDWLDRPPQTNEVRRSAVLIAAASWLAAQVGLPIRLWELGASAGLNLMFDRYALDAAGHRRGPAVAALTLAPEWHGPPPPDAPLRVIGRRGVDLAPIDPQSADGRLRLLAYLWPDQPERRALTEAAVALAEAPVDRGDAIAWLAPRFRPEDGVLGICCHTVAWQYFPPETRAQGEEVLAAAGARARPKAPLARIAMEADGKGPGAAISVQLWPPGDVVELGRAEFHGRWIDWSPPDQNGREDKGEGRWTAH
jgi:hypothetical protein